MPDVYLFDDDYYFTQKLNAMKATDSTYTAEKLTATLANAGFSGKWGLFAHFALYGQYEDLSPTGYFDVEDYYTAKAAQMFATDTVTAEQYMFTKTTIADAGMSAWGHYTEYGHKEGVNPSNTFDCARYKAAKLADMQKTDPAATMYTLDTALELAGLSPVAHYILYGKREGFIQEASLACANPVNPPDISNYEPPNPGQTPGGTGETLYLTAQADTLHGTGRDDVFQAGYGTLQFRDVIDGGAGWDILNVVGAANIASISRMGLHNVEVVQLQGGSARTALDISGNTAVREIVSLDQDATPITVNLNQTVTFSGSRYSDAKVTYQAPDANDAATVNLNGMRSSEGLLVNGVEHLTLHLAGANFLSDDISGRTLRSVTITGEYGATLSADEIQAPYINASGLTGSIKLSLSDDYATTVIGSSGNDTMISEGRADLLTGGSGNDNFVLDEELDGRMTVHSLQTKVATITDFSHGDMITVRPSAPGARGFASSGAIAASSEADLVAKINAHLMGRETTVQVIHFNNKTYLAANGDASRIDDDQVVCLVGTYDPGALTMEQGVISML